MRPSESRLHRWLAVALAVAALAALISTFIGGAASDEEEFRFTVLSSWLHVQALMRGDYGFWTSFLGFGAPQPLIANYWMHPLLPLLAFMPPVAWTRMLLLVHSVIGALGMWRLCRAVDVRPIVAAICVTTFLLATPSQNYVMVDFWPSVWVALTSMPWVILWTWRLLNPATRNPATWAAALGLASGFVLANGNPGNVIIYITVAAGIVAANLRAAKARWRYLVAAGAITLAISAPNAALLVNEGPLFAEDLNRPTGMPLPLSETWDVFLRPLSQSGMPWQDDVIERGVRNLFFGGPFAVLCLIGIARRGWQRPELAIAVVAAALPLFGAAPAMSASDEYLYRDPLILCAVPLAGMAAEQGLRRSWSRIPTALTLAAQLGVVGLAVFPFLSESWAEGRDGAKEFHGGVADAQIADAIVAAMESPGRLLYSPQVDYEVRERSLLIAGLGVNAMAYRNVLVINSWLKGVSAGVIWPDERRYYARIRPPDQLLASGATLDVLGVRYVLARQGETVAGDLRQRGELSTRGGDLVFYENDDAWPRAFVLDTAAIPSFPVLPGCPNDRLLCRDLSAATALRRDTKTTVTGTDGVIEVTLPALSSPGLLVVTEMFRPQWTASADGTTLQVQPFADSLMAIALPAGTTSVRLTYRPWPMVAATVLAFAAVLGSVGVLLVDRRRRTRTDDGARSRP